MEIRSVNAIDSRTEAGKDALDGWTVSAEGLGNGQDGPAA